MKTNWKLKPYYQNKRGGRTMRVARIGDRILMKVPDRPRSIRGILCEVWLAKPLAERGYKCPWCVRILPDRYQRGIKKLRGPDKHVGGMLDDLLFNGAKEPESRPTKTELVEELIQVLRPPKVAEDVVRKKARRMNREVLEVVINKYKEYGGQK